MKKLLLYNSQYIKNKILYYLFQQNKEIYIPLILIIKELKVHLKIIIKKLILFIVNNMVMMNYYLNFVHKKIVLLNILGMIKK